MAKAARVLTLGFFLVSSNWAFAAEDPKAILAEADRARGASQSGVSWQVKLESVEDSDTTATTYKVRAMGSNAHVETLEPARSKGEIFLFNDRTIWFYKPSLKKPVAISARQKLSGQAANGDIASTNYARDYVGKVVGSEKVAGDDCYVLELKSIGENTTYDGIKYWVSKKKKLGLKAEFLSLQGKVLKIAEFKYGNTMKIKGKKIDFVSTMKLTDANNKKNYSTMSYSNPAEEKVPAALFNSNNLLR